MLSTTSDAGAKDAIAAENWGWSKDDFDPLGADYEVTLQCGTENPCANASPQQQQESKRCSPSPSAPVELPKSSKHSPMPSLSSFTRLANVPAIPTLPTAQELSSARHGNLQHVESKGHVVKKKPRKNKTTTNFANLSLAAKQPSKRRVNNGPESPPK